MGVSVKIWQKGDLTDYAELEGLARAELGMIDKVMGRGDIKADIKGSLQDLRTSIEGYMGSFASRKEAKSEIPFTRPDIVIVEVRKAVGKK